MAATPAPAIACPSIDTLIPCSAGSVAADGSAACGSCLPAHMPTTFHANSSVRRKHDAQPIYLVLLVPAYWGSSGLEGLLSSSPAVSTMCGHCTWQCEATWSLCDDGAFECNHEAIWDPKQTNWSQVYDLYATKGYFDDPTKPLLMEKSPPNMAKVESLVAFYDEKGYDYRFIAMARHPCTNSRHDWAPYKNINDEFARAQAAADPEKLFLLSYDDLRTRPDLVAKDLLAWLPELGSLDLNVSHVHASDDDAEDALTAAKEGDDELSLGRPPRAEGHARRDRGRGGGRGRGERMAAKGGPDNSREDALLPYIQSESCKLKVYAEHYTNPSLIPWSACKHCSG